VQLRPQIVGRRGVCSDGSLRARAKRAVEHIAESLFENVFKSLERLPIEVGRKSGGNPEAVDIVTLQDELRHDELELPSKYGLLLPADPPQLNDDDLPRHAVGDLVVRRQPCPLCVDQEAIGFGRLSRLLGRRDSFPGVSRVNHVIGHELAYMPPILRLVPHVGPNVELLGSLLGSAHATQYRPC
jgi:hypothetical protein